MEQDIYDESQAFEPLLMFQPQMDIVEGLMQACMLPLMRKELLLGEAARHKAFKMLEFWSELYRYGLEAAGMGSAREEEWLHQARQSLRLNAQAENFVLGGDNA